MNWTDWTIFASMLLGYAGWVGFLLGKRAAEKELRHKVITHDKLVERARQTKAARRFTGPGIQIINQADWTLRGVGKFVVSIEENDAFATEEI